MPRLILKIPYLKGGNKNAPHLQNLVKYIATRDGVDFVYKNPHAKETVKQKDLIKQIVKEFPSVKSLFEYEDYLKNPTVENASDFITIALEHNLDVVAKKENYAHYIANRPNVEKMESHGLFTSGGEKIILSKVAEEVAKHNGNVWTPIISLRREDAAAFGYDSATAWKSVLESQASVIAENLKIPLSHFRWYAAFHNESHHPHVHMICYSTDTRYGYLTKDGIRNIKSKLVGEIFKEQLHEIYAMKTQKRDELKQEAQKSFAELRQKLQSGDFSNPQLENLITELHEKLQQTTGKRQYRYMKAPVKQLIDRITDELAKTPEVAKIYRLWCELQNEIYLSYQDNLPEPLPLFEQKEFSSIKNMIIKEVLTLEQMDTVQTEKALSIEDMTSAEDEMTAELEVEPYPQTDEVADESVMVHGDMLVDEPSTYHTERPSHRHRPHPKRTPKKSTDGYHVTWSEDYKQAKIYLHGDDETEQDFELATEYFTSEAEDKNALAMFDLAKMYADGLATPTGDIGIGDFTKTAERLYTAALFAFEQIESEYPYKYIEYRIGKMYAQGLGTEQNYETAAHFFTLSANEQYRFAEYSLGGLYYRGQGVEQDYEKAHAFYLRSAMQGFPYAQYEVAKMYRDGIGTKKNVAKSKEWFQKAFAGFESLEKQSHDDKVAYRLGAMLEKGIGAEMNIPRAKKYYEQAATIGNSFACYALAKLILQDEQSTDTETKKAIAYLQTASDNDNQFAQYALAKIYLEGTYADKDVAKALELFHRSAEQGNPFSNYKLGKLYLGTEDVLKDISKAIKHLTLSADVKNHYAEYTLGMLYLKGEDVTKGIVNALDFLNRASEQGNESAKYRLGILYLKGEDVPKDVVKAITHLTEIAESGNQYAQYQLGKLYLLGKDAPQDKETAIKWLTMSAEQGNEYARFFLDNMDKWQNPSVGSCVLRLFHSLGKTFDDRIPQDGTTTHQRIDSKSLRKLREKKMAQGQKIGEPEQENLEQRLKT